LAGWLLHENVKLEEALFEGLLVTLALETLQLHKLSLEVFLDPQGNLLTYSNEQKSEQLVLEHDCQLVAREKPLC